MSGLSDFLLEHPVLDLREQIIVSARLRDYPFTVSNATSAQMESYVQQCRRGQDRFDGHRFHLLLVLNHCETPDFRDVAALERAGCDTPEQYVERVLKAGEIAAIARAVYRLSGYEQTMAELVDAVKN